MTITRLHILALALGTLSPFALAAPVGTVLFSRGDVQIVDGLGKSRPALRGAVVQAGEHLLAPPGTVSQLKLLDGSLFAVRPDSEIKFDLPNRAAPQARQVVSLLSGGVRVINLDQGDGRTPVPVILQTIAGNISLPAGDVESFYVQPGSKSAVGSYTRLISGSGSIKSGGFETALDVRRVAFVPKLDVLPAETTSFASSMFATPVFTSAMAVPISASGEKTTLVTDSGALSKSTLLGTKVSSTTSTLTSPLLSATTNLSLAKLSEPTGSLPSGSGITTLKPAATASFTPPLTAVVTPIASIAPIVVKPAPIIYVPPPLVFVTPTTKTTTVKCTTVKC